MNKKQIISKIKVLLGMVKEEFATAKLADGSEISFDSLEINREVYDSEGNPLPAGEYVLEDGTKLTLDENGVIKEIETADSETKEEIVTEELACGEPKEKKEEKLEDVVEEKVEEKVEEPDSAVEYATKDDVEEIKREIEDIYAMLLQLTEQQTIMSNDFRTTKESFNKYLEQPSTQTVTRPNVTTFENKFEKIKKLKHN